MLAAVPGAAPALAKPPNGLCMNYGHDGYKHDLSPDGLVAQDLRRLELSGINCLRIVYNGFNDAQAEALALFAKAHGFYVVSGGEWGMLDPAQLPNYQAQALRQAQWAQANGIPQFSIGNEQDDRLSGLSQSQWAEAVVALAAKVHEVYSGTVSYETPRNRADAWAQVDLGSLDLLGLNMYDGYDIDRRALAENIATHGAQHVYVSETNCGFHSAAHCRPDAALAEEMKGDLLRLIGEFRQTAFYIYTWRATGQDSIFSVVDYPKTMAVLGIQ
ncbi:MAG TPA: hypothetical protein VHY10_01635 [Xanthobacteraceae bacterium]|jgi:hypothetical protein|nr:hypothetical protein [Xanthobacteraceae bacterium]